MFRLFRNLKPMAWVFVAIVLLVTGQAVAELYLPEQMSDIIDDGIYIDYEPLYRYEEMERPSSLAAVESDATLKGYDEDTIPVFEMVDGFTTYDLAEAIEEEEGGVEGAGDAEAHPEDGGVVVLRGVGRLYDGGVEAALDDDVAHVHEDQHDGEHAELARGEEPRHHHLDGERDDGRAPLLEELPEEGADGHGLELFGAHGPPLS